MELITPDLTCPLTHQLLQNSRGDSGLDLSFDKSASLKHLFGLARVSLVEASKLDLSFGWSRIEPTVTLFRVFQTLCKQGDWFSFAKRRAPFPVCIDDNHSYMKHWKSGFFLIDRQDISDFMVWRHPNVAINDPQPAAGSFSMDGMRRLSVHVIKLRDMPEGVLVLSGLSRVWKSHVYDMVLRGADGNVMGIHDFLCLPEWTGAEVREEPHLDVSSTLQRLPFYCTPPANVDAIIPDPTLKDLAIGTSSSKILAKVEASQKRKPSTFGATLSHVAKCTGSALAQSSGSTTRPSLFVGDFDDKSDGDDDACVKILLVTPLCSATVIPSSGNQGRSSTVPAAEGSNTRDSQGKGIMVDDVVAPSVGASRPRPSSGPAPSFMDVSGNTIHADFFPFSTGPYYTTYPQDGVAGNCEFTCEEWDAPYRPTFGVLTKEVFKDPVCKTVVDQFPTPGEMVRVEALPEDQLTAKITDSRLKGYEERVTSVARLELQVSTLKKQVSELNDKLVSSDASFAKSKAKGKERKKKIKSLTKSLDNLHAEVARLSATLNQAIVLEAEKDEEILRLKATPEYASFFRCHGELLSLVTSAEFERGLSMHRTKDELYFISEHASEPLSVILQLEPENLTRPAKRHPRKVACVSPPITKESTVTPTFKSLELSTNSGLALSVVASEHNEEMGISVSLEDAVELVVIGLGCASSCPNDVVVTLSAGDKGDGLVPSAVAGDDAAANPSRV
ncbi:hypothetical protein Tco_0578957 [Tanacetum coccineum]